MLNRHGTHRRRNSRAGLVGWVLLLATTVTVLAMLPPVVVDRALSALPAVLGLGPATLTDAGEGLPVPSIEGIVVPPPPPSPLNSVLAPRVISPIEWTPRGIVPPGPALDERLVAHRPAARWPARNAIPNLDPLIPQVSEFAPSIQDASRWRVFTRASSAVGKGVVKGSTTVAKGVAKGSTTVAKGVAKVSTTVAKGVAKAGVSTAKVFKRVGLFLTRPFRGQSEDERQTIRWVSS